MDDERLFLPKCYAHAMIRVFLAEGYKVTIEKNGITEVYENPTFSQRIK